MCVWDVRYEGGGVKFESMVSVDTRVSSMLRRLGFTHARPVQELSLPHALAGVDVLLKAPTGTGKTLAYVIPILTSILGRRLQSPLFVEYGFGEKRDSKTAFRHRLEAVVLVPSKELVGQVSKVFQDLLYQCSDFVQCHGIADCPATLADLRLKFTDFTAVLVTHPGAFIKIGQLLMKEIQADPHQSHLCLFPNVQQLVVDEADLILSVYGYDQETRSIFSPHAFDLKVKATRQTIPVSLLRIDHLAANKCQVMLCSATINQDLNKLKHLALYKPAVLVVVGNENELKRTRDIRNGEIRSVETHSTARSGETHSTARSVETHSTAESELDEDPGTEESFTDEAAILEIDRSECVMQAMVLSSDMRKRMDHRYVVVDPKCFDEYLVLVGVLQNRLYSMGEDKPRTLVFVNDIKKAIKTELVLSALGFKVARAVGCQNAKTRSTNIHKFNSGQIDVLVGMDCTYIAGTAAESATVSATALASSATALASSKTDVSAVIMPSGTMPSGTMPSGTMLPVDDEEILAELNIAAPKRKRRRKVNLSESSIARGIDFRKVARVILLDPPANLTEYVHKVGRCGREIDATLIPTVLTCLPTEALTDPVWKEVASEFRPTTPDVFQLTSFDSLRYRVEDKCRAASKSAIKAVLERELCSN
ncbi:RNA helicase [Gregarina niphandrodes]|uniref:ATP-dependent RNA helicase n=1 Tax=Gregarina niphandrodes TaxID=110365 RepID=A0A023B980_GRENI|nr:RNA helicase [Gregarina niphandrodes]EZG71574.1 RNA helicase [Gregarina niphandrodes]|eukprot:XP_011129819.1 RNA helicase [Gregarina niphandrodes]